MAGGAMGSGAGAGAGSGAGTGGNGGGSASLGVVVGPREVGSRSLSFVVSFNGL